MLKIKGNSSVCQASCPPNKHLFSRDEIRYHEGGRTAEKVLDLPARSRFGEGRAKPLWCLTTSVEKLMKNFFLANMEVTHAL
jgi:hypothetical protein